MRYRFLIPLGALAALALTACAGSTGPPSPGPVEATAAAHSVVEAPEKPAVDQGVVCRYERVTGTHIVSKVCTTQAARDQIEQDSKTALRKLQRPGAGCATPGCE